MTRGPDPTPRQRLVYETAKRLGSQTAAAKSLGLSPGAVSSAVAHYRRKTGAPHPTPTRALYPGARDQQLSIRDAAALLPNRMANVEDELASVSGQLDAIATELKALRDVIHDFTQRQPLVLEVRATHRRKVDGGHDARGEVAAVRRAIA